MDDDLIMTGWGGRGRERLGVKEGSVTVGQGRPHQHQASFTPPPALRPAEAKLQGSWLKSGCNDPDRIYDLRVHDNFKQKKLPLKYHLRLDS